MSAHEWLCDGQVIEAADDAALCTAVFCPQAYTAEQEAAAAAGDLSGALAYPDEGAVVGTLEKKRDGVTVWGPVDLYQAQHDRLVAAGLIT